VRFQSIFLSQLFQSTFFCSHFFNQHFLLTFFPINISCSHFFQSTLPLDPNTPIDPFTTPSLTGLDAQTGIFLDADQTNSSVLIKTADTPAMYIDKFQNMGINTTAPSAQLDVNSASSSHIQLTYNGSATSKAQIGVSSDGKLLLTPGGSEVSIDSTSSLNIKGHNGSNAGLMLGNSLVLATADQLNFSVVTPGTASNNKALVTNSSGSIAGINSLSASQLTGTIQTADQPNITSVNTLDVANHNGITGLALGGTTVTATAQELNYVDTTPGMATASKALVLNGDRDILNIHHLSADQLTGTLQTAAQPNVTSLGTLTNLNFDGPLTGLTDLSVNTTETGRTLVLNHETGNTLRMFYDAETSANNYADLLIDSMGNMMVTTTGGNVDITTHDGVSQGPEAWKRSGDCVCGPAELPAGNDSWRCNFRKGCGDGCEPQHRQHQLSCVYKSGWYYPNALAAQHCVSVRAEHHHSRRRQRWFEARQRPCNGVCG
jgi:hypothetical protein